MAMFLACLLAMQRLLGVAEAAGGPPPAIVLHRQECALRELAFNWSQALLPHAGAEQDAAVVV